jgi:hypothetical protein
MKKILLTWLGAKATEAKVRSWLSDHDLQLDVVVDPEGDTEART